METVTFMGNRAGQNAPAPHAGGSSLPGDPLAQYLTTGLNEIRVQSTTALPTRQAPPGIKSAEWTYSLMMYMAGSLGVNCTYCHNTRAMARWEAAQWRQPLDRLLGAVGCRQGAGGHADAAGSACRTGAARSAESTRFGEGAEALSRSGDAE